MVLNDIYLIFNLQDIKLILKGILFLGYIAITIYLLATVVSFVKRRIDKNDERIKSNYITIDELIGLSSIPYETKPNSERDEKMFEWLLNKLDSLYKENLSISKYSIELWKWKIGTLITIAGMLLAVIKLI